MSRFRQIPSIGHYPHGATRRLGQRAVHRPLRRAPLQLSLDSIASVVVRSIGVARAPQDNARRIVQRALGGHILRRQHGRGSIGEDAIGVRPARTQGEEPITRVSRGPERKGEGLA